MIRHVPQARCPVCGEWKNAHTLSNTGCYTCDMTAYQRERQEAEQDIKKMDAKLAAGRVGKLVEKPNLREQLASKGREWLERQQAEPTATKAPDLKARYLEPGSYVGDLNPLPRRPQVHRSGIAQPIALHVKPEVQRLCRVFPTGVPHEIVAVDVSLDVVGHWDTSVVGSLEVDVCLIVVSSQPQRHAVGRILLPAPNEPQKSTVVRAIAMNIDGPVEFNLSLLLTEQHKDGSRVIGIKRNVVGTTSLTVTSAMLQTTQQG